MSKVRYVDAFARIFTIYYWKWLLAALIVYIYLCECELMCMLQCSCWRQKTMRSLLRSREPQKLSSGHDLLMLPSTHQTISLALFVTLTIISARGKCIEHRVLKILRIPFIIYLCACICVCMYMCMYIVHASTNTNVLLSMKSRKGQDLLELEWETSNEPSNVGSGSLILVICRSSHHSYPPNKTQI